MLGRFTCLSPEGMSKFALLFVCKVQADKSCSKEEIAEEGSDKNNLLHHIIKGLMEGTQNDADKGNSIWTQEEWHSL